MTDNKFDDLKQLFDKVKNKKTFCIACLSAVVIVLFVIVACLGKNNNKALTGKWRYDQYTVYEFDGNGHGCTYIDDRATYEFDYTAKNSKLKIDYSDDYITDCEYTFEIDGENLILTGEKGTVSIGETYNLTKE